MNGNKIKESTDKKEDMEAIVLLGDFYFCLDSDYRTVIQLFTLKYVCINMILKNFKIKI